MEDQFGRDPQVRYMRQVFAGMEQKQGELLERIGFSPTDYRLRRVRDGALKFFEKAWMLARRRGVAETEDEIADLYILCLAHVLIGNRITVPVEFIPKNTTMNDITKEVFK